MNAQKAKFARRLVRNYLHKSERDVREQPYSPPRFKDVQLPGEQLVRTIKVAKGIPMRLDPNCGRAVYHSIKSTLS